MRLPIIAVLLTALPMATAMAQAPAAPSGQMPPGHPPMDQMQTAPKAEMNHSGTVEETLAASPYIYIHVKAADGEQWLAAPAVDLKKGTTIRWPDGMPMKNFFSKTLQRNFDTVFFVTAVEVVPGK